MKAGICRQVFALSAVLALAPACGSSKPPAVTRPIDHALAACRHMADRAETTAEATAKYDAMVREATGAAQGDQRWQPLFEAVRDERDYHQALSTGQQKDALGFTTVVRQVEARCADVPGSGLVAPSS